MRPEAPLVEVFDRFSDQPLVNQVYAMGVEALHGEGAATARPYFEVALDRDPGVQWARIRLSECLETLGEGAASKDAAEEVLEAAQSEDRPDLERAALLQLAFLTRRTGEYAESKTYYEKVLSHARNRDDRTGIADALRGLGNRLGDANTLHNLGDLDKTRGRLEQSIEFAGQALAIFEDLGDEFGVGRASVNLAECLLLLGREDEAQAYLRKAVEWDPEAGVVLVARGLDAYRRGHFAEVRRSQEQAKAVSGESWRPIQEGRLQAYIEAERSGRAVPLPLERRRAEQSLP